MEDRTSKSPLQLELEDAVLRNCNYIKIVDGDSVCEISPEETAEYLLKKFIITRREDG